MAEDLEQEEPVEVREPFVRLVADGPTSRHARIELVTPTEDADVVSEIPHVRRATFTLEAGNVNEAALEMLVVEGEIPAELVTLREIAVPPPLEPRIVVAVFASRRRWFGLRRSRVMVQRHTLAGVSGAIVDVLADGWMRASDAALYEATEQSR